MKVIVFVEDFGATGVVRNAIAIASHLARGGHQVILLAARADGVLRSSVPESVATAALNQADSGLKRSALMRRSLLRFRKFLREQRPDIVFSAGNHGHLLSLAATRFIPCRTIVRISNDLYHREDELNSKRLSQRIRKLKFRTILGLADRVVLVSRRLLDQASAVDPEVARKAEVIPNGVDGGVVRAQAAGSAPELTFGDSSAPLVLAMGRLVPQKNFATLLEAVSIARRSTDLRLLLIGSGPLEHDLNRHASRLGLCDSLRLIDPIPNPFPAMKQAAVMVLPSWWEGSSNVLLEALACGTPVVASRTAGSAREILDDGRYGLLVDPDDAEGMAAAILQQVGPKRLPPQDRADAYDRAASLEAYGDLIAGLAAR